MDSDSSLSSDTDARHREYEERYHRLLHVAGLKSPSSDDDDDIGPSRTVRGLRRPSLRDSFDKVAAYTDGDGTSGLRSGKAPQSIRLDTRGAAEELAAAQRKLAAFQERSRLHKDAVTPLTNPNELKSVISQLKTRISWLEAELEGERSRTTEITALQQTVENLRNQLNIERQRAEKERDARLRVEVALADLQLYKESILDHLATSSAPSQTVRKSPTQHANTHSNGSISVSRALDMRYEPSVTPGEVSRALPPRQPLSHPIPPPLLSSPAIPPLSSPPLSPPPPSSHPLSSHPLSSAALPYAPLSYATPGAMQPMQHYTTPAATGVQQKMPSPIAIEMEASRIAEEAIARARLEARIADLDSEIGNTDGIHAYNPQMHMMMPPSLNTTATYVSNQHREPSPPRVVPQSYWYSASPSSSDTATAHNASRQLFTTPVPIDVASYNPAPPSSYSSASGKRLEAIPEDPVRETMDHYTTRDAHLDGTAARQW